MEEETSVETGNLSLHDTLVLLGRKLYDIGSQDGADYEFTLEVGGYKYKCNNVGNSIRKKAKTGEWYVTNVIAKSPLKIHISPEKEDAPFKERDLKIKSSEYVGEEGDNQDTIFKRFKHAIRVRIEDYIGSVQPKVTKELIPYVSEPSPESEEAVDEITPEITPEIEQHSPKGKIRKTIYIQSEQEKKLSKRVNPSQLGEIYKKLKSGLDKEAGGIVHIYDIRGNLLDSCNTEEEAIQKLNDLLRKGETSYIGDNFDDAIIVSLDKTDLNEPMFRTSLLRDVRSLNPKIADEYEILVNINRLKKDGLNSSDLAEMATNMIDKKLEHELDKKIGEHSEAMTGKPSKLYNSIKRISIDDIKKLKEIAHRKTH